MFPNLIRLWNVARERIEASDILIVVGFSFSEADSYINKIIERSMAFKDNQVMIVCDPNASLAPNLRARYSARIEGFDDNRVIQGVGSGDEMLPKVLSHLTLHRVRIDVSKKRTKLKADRLEEAAAAE